MNQLHHSQRHGRWSHLCILLAVLATLAGGRPAQTAMRLIMPTSTWTKPPTAFSTQFSSNTDVQALAFPSTVGENTHPSAIGLIGNTGGEVNTVAISGTLAYVGEDDEISIFDIRDPATPTRRSHLSLGGAVQDIQVVGNLAYIANNAGLQIIDVSNPSSPVQRGSYPTPKYVYMYSVWVTGNLAYVLKMYVTQSPDAPTLEILDVSDPAHPTLFGSYVNPCGGGYDVQVVDHLAYILYSCGFLILDVSAPAHPVVLSNNNFHGLQLQITGNLAVIASWDSVLILDISDSTHPALRSRFQIPDGDDVRGVQATGDRAYIASGESGLRILDLSDPAHPFQFGHYDTPGWANRVQVVGGLAYIADGTAGLQIVAISDLVLRGSYDTPGQAYDVQVKQNLAYIADGGSGLQIIDVSNPASPKLRGSYAMGYAVHVQVQDNLAYVIAGDLQIIDITDPAHPTLRGTWGGATDVQVVGSLAYVAAGGGGLTILDVSNPANPTVRGALDTPGSAQSVWIAGDRAYVIDSISLTYVILSRLMIIDVSNPTNPTLLSSTLLTSNTNAIQVVDGLAYVTAVRGFQIIDVSNAANPIQRGYYNGTLSYIPSNLQVRNKLVYVADGGGGLEIIDVSDPDHPTQRIGYGLLGNVTDVDVVGNLAYTISYLPNKNTRLYIIDVSNLFSPQVFLPLVRR